MISNEMHGLIIGANRVGNRARTLHSYIYSVMDEVKIYEQNKSIDTGLLYLKTEFEVVMAGSNLLGVSNVAILARNTYKTPKCILPREMV